MRGWKTLASILIFIGTSSSAFSRILGPQTSRVKAAAQYAHDETYGEWRGSYKEGLKKAKNFFKSTEFDKIVWAFEHLEARTIGQNIDDFYHPIMSVALHDDHYKSVRQRSVFLLSRMSDEIFEDMHLRLTSSKNDREIEIILDVFGYDRERGRAYVDEIRSFIDSPSLGVRRQAVETFTFVMDRENQEQKILILDLYVTEKDRRIRRMAYHVAAQMEEIPESYLSFFWPVVLHPEPIGSKVLSIRIARYQAVELMRRIDPNLVIQLHEEIQKREHDRDDSKWHGLMYELNPNYLLLIGHKGLQADWENRGSFDYSLPLAQSAYRLEWFERLNLESLHLSETQIDFLLQEMALDPSLQLNPTSLERWEESGPRILFELRNLSESFRQMSPAAQEMLAAYFSKDLERTLVYFDHYGFSESLELLRNKEARLTQDHSVWLLKEWNKVLETKSHLAEKEISLFLNVIGKLNFSGLGLLVLEEWVESFALFWVEEKLSLGQEEIFSQVLGKFLSQTEESALSQEDRNQLQEIRAEAIACLN